MTEVIHQLDFVNGWFLMGSPIYVTIILSSYLLFVTKIGPWFMNNRQPYRFNVVISLYNAVQVLISCFLVYVSYSMVARYGLIPRTCMMETEAGRKDIANSMYYYLAAKLSELLDTVFFVLRKKYSQVSFLHVYHHTLMVIVTWTALKYEPTFTLLFLGLLNSFIHIIMYTYYGLSAIPGIAEYLWWKKYITSLQLVQFVAVAIHFGIVCVLSECAPSKIMTVALFLNAFLFLYLFGKFYINTYTKKCVKKHS